MRCPECNKFVAYDEPQCESNGVDMDVLNVRATVTVQLNCADCVTRLKDAVIEAETEIEHTCKPEAERPEDQKPDPQFKGGDEQFEIENEGDPEGTIRTETKDRHGKPIKLSRYMKTFYGFTQETEVRCRRCGECFTVTLAGEEQASGFNECC